MATTNITSAATSNAASRRPALIRSATAQETATPTCSNNEATPLLSRPLISRTTSAVTVLQNPGRIQHPSTKNNRPSLLRRATELVSSSPELNINDKDKPRAPSHWTDYAHRKPLLQIWDGVNDAATMSKYATSIKAQLFSTEKRMLERYPELGEGEQQLTKEWMEYVLGVCLRHPFCTAGNMSKWQVLGSSAGARGVWGPF
jgi:hypothetical protein